MDDIAAFGNNCVDSDISQTTVIMSMELIAIIGVGITLAGLILNGQHNLQKEIGGLRKEINGLRERMAHLEGLLEGLREAITGRRVAEEAGKYDTR